MARAPAPTTADDINRRRDQLFEALSTESDRSLILVAASFLDEALEALQRARFCKKKRKGRPEIGPLFDMFGPLSSFSAKIRIAYALDLIEEWTYRDLEIIRKLRNVVAHNIEDVRFDAQNISQLTKRLEAANIAVSYTKKPKKEANGLQKPGVATGSSQPDKGSMERTRFIMSVTFVGGLVYANTLLLKSNMDARALDRLAVVPHSSP